MRLLIKRVYEPKSDSDGRRILVDRLWPRGLSKQTAAIDLWLKEIAPSSELRKWFDHDPAKWDEFRRRYRARTQREPARRSPALKEAVGDGQATLLYAARDERHNHALVLRDLLAERD